MTELSMPLSNVQMELLKLYSTNLSDEELHELKLMLGKFYAERAIRLADRIWDERGLTNEDMKKSLEKAI